VAILSPKEKLSYAEFSQMIRLLNRYVSTDMDQWELWTFDTPLSKIYVNITLMPSGPEDVYTNLNHLLNEPKEST
jgi:hypothetical protein